MYIFRNLDFPNFYQGQITFHKSLRCKKTSFWLCTIPENLVYITFVVTEIYISIPKICSFFSYYTSDTLTSYSTCIITIITCIKLLLDSFVHTTWPRLNDFDFVGSLVPNILDILWEDPSTCRSLIVLMAHTW
jgi:hypothetical protein